MLETRKYDTSDVEGSKKVARDIGLIIVSTKDLGDQHEIVLRGETECHNEFREHEGYAESEAPLIEA